MQNNDKVKPSSRSQTKVSLRVLKPKNSQIKNAKSNPIYQQSFDETDYQKHIAISVNQLNSQPENDNFLAYYTFVINIMENIQFQKMIFDKLKFQETLVPQRTMKLSIRSFSIDKSFNGQQITSLQDFNIYKKRISIQLIKSNLSLDSLGSIQYDSDSVFQSQSLLTKQLISQFFETPSPFIMIQSLCLLLKYLWRTKIVLNKQNCVKVLLISIMLAFKLCYDQQVQGIGWYYASVVGMDSKQISKLEAKFLKQLQFQTDVTKQQYFTVSTYLLGKQKQK